MFRLLLSSSSSLSIVIIIIIIIIIIIVVVVVVVVVVVFVVVVVVVAAAAAAVIVVVVAVCELINCLGQTWMEHLAFVPRSWTVYNTTVRFSHNRSGRFGTDPFTLPLVLTVRTVYVLF